MLAGKSSKVSMNFINPPPLTFFLLILTLVFGSWLLYVGLVKWIVFGPEGFLSRIFGVFDNIWSPDIFSIESERFVKSCVLPNEIFKLCATYDSKYLGVFCAEQI